ncbi:MAG: CBS domain-containing protein [Alphaproteobacteria bacterium]|nr:CBS domain-containing protein [Alphaproteobacteria bacterium]
MKVSEIMTRHVQSIRPTTPVAGIARFLLDHGISAAPVVGEHEELLGVVSEADLIHREELGTAKRRAWWLASIAEGFRDPDDRAREYARTHGQLAKDVMTRGAITIHADADLADAAALMDDKRVKRLYVTEDAALVGVVTRTDLVRALARQLARPKDKRTDGEIRDELQRRIRSAEWATSAWVTVTVHQGNVDLIGGVESDAQRQAIVVMAQEIAGVRHVNDHLVKRRMPSTTLY